MFQTDSETIIHANVREFPHVRPRSTQLRCSSKTIALLAASWGGQQITSNRYRGSTVRFGTTGADWLAPIQSAVHTSEGSVSSTHLRHTGPSRARAQVSKSQVFDLFGSGSEHGWHGCGIFVLVRVVFYVFFFQTNVGCPRF